MTYLKSIFEQSAYAIRFEWGLAGVEALAADSDVMIIVDVLSFSTSVNIATDCGAFIYPYRYEQESAQRFAESIGAAVAVPRSKASSENVYSLSPASLTTLRHGERLVLPSPNGSTCCARAIELGTAAVMAGSLVSAAATARVAQQRGERISVIAAGERWPDGTLRPALEDYFGAGAILAALPDASKFSPEAQACRLLCTSLGARVQELLTSCVSGQELISLGFSEDVRIAGSLNRNATASLCVGDHFSVVG